MRLPPADEDGLEEGRASTYADPVGSPAAFLTAILAVLLRVWRCDSSADKPDARNAALRLAELAFALPTLDASVSSELEESSSDDVDPSSSSDSDEEEGAPFRHLDQDTAADIFLLLPLRR